MSAKQARQEGSEAYQNVLREGEEKPDPLDDHSSVEAYRAARGIPMPSDEEEPQPGDYDSIEDLFAQRVERISDYGDAFDVSHFEDLKPYIANWDTLLEIIDEENTEGFSERWEEVKFKFGPKGMRSEDDEGWGRVAKGDLLGSFLGKGAITGGLAGAAYHALKGKTPKKKEDKEDKGFTKGGW
jgi:hypothetical protein